MSFYVVRILLEDKTTRVYRLFESSKKRAELRVMRRFQKETKGILFFPSIKKTIITEIEIKEGLFV